MKKARKITEIPQKTQAESVWFFLFCYPNKSKVVSSQPVKGGITMNSEKLEKQSQRLSKVLSEFDDILKDIQSNFVPSPNMIDIQREELLKAIDSDLSDINESVCEIGEKIEKFKSFEGIL